MIVRVGVLVFVALWPAVASVAQSEPSFGFYFENDVDFLSGENNDRFYTNGVRIDIHWPNCALPGPLQRRWERKGTLPIPFVPARGSLATCEPGEPVVGLSEDVDVFSFGLRIGQSLYTPENLDVAVLQPRDRPYAAWLYVGAAFNRMSSKHMRTLQLDVGVVGPSAFGEEVQDWVHKNITDSREAQGWDNQIPDEPAILFTYEERWRLAPQTIEITRQVEGGEATGGITLFDFVPKIGVHLGNVFTEGIAAATARFGWNVPADFGPAARLVSVYEGLTPSDLPNRWELYLFAAAEARGVVRAIFLDGTVFSESHSVPKEDIVVDLEWGIAIRYRGVRLTYRRVRRSKEFLFQGEEQRFGSANLTFHVPYRRR